MQEEIINPSAIPVPTSRRKSSSRLGLKSDTPSKTRFFLAVTKFAELPCQIRVVVVGNIGYDEHNIVCFVPGQALSDCTGLVAEFVNQCLNTFACAWVNFVFFVYNRETVRSKLQPDSRFQSCFAHLKFLYRFSLTQKIIALILRYNTA